MRLMQDHDSLKSRYDSLAAELKSTELKLLEAVRSRASHQELVEKYEDSARHGSETIAALQESLLTVCSQLDEERARHQRALQEAADTASVNEKALKSQISALRETICKLEMEVATNEAALIIKIAQRKRDSALDPIDGGSSGCSASRSSVNSPARVTSFDRDSVQNSISRSPKSLVDLDYCDNTGTRSIVSIEEIDDDDEDDFTPTKSLPKATKQVERKQKKTHRDGSTKHNGVCGECRKYSFGIMLRCHKCQDQFHVGCTKQSRQSTGGKRKLGSVFQCDKCAPLQQRPPKVCRSWI